MLIFGYYFWFKEGEEPMKISDLCEEKNLEEPSTEEVVLQDLQRASEKVCVVILILILILRFFLIFDQSCNIFYKIFDYS